MAKSWHDKHSDRLKDLADELADALDNNLIDQTNRWGARSAYAAVLQAWSALNPPAAS